MEVSFFACQKAIARIYNSDREVKGTGFLISSRYLLTCAHVVINALEIEQAHISDIPQQELSIDFLSSLEKVSRRGKVIVWQPCPTLFDTNLEQATFGEDIALLELNEAIPSSQIETIDLVSLPLEKFDQEQPKFSTYGFPSGSDNGKKTEGIIFGVQATRWLQLQGTDNRPLILGGYSGSPLFAETTQGTGIVGMTVASEYHYSDKQEKYLGGKEAYAIPALALAEVWFKQGWLIECLSSCDKKWIEKAYNHCRQREWNTTQPQKIEEFVKDLYQYSDPENNYLLEFVLYLITQADFSEELKAQLRQWAERAYQLTEVELGQECDRFIRAWELEQTPEKTDIDSRLWIILNHAGAKAQYIIESAYYIKDINNYQRDNPDSYQEINIESRTFSISLGELAAKE